MTTHSIMTWVTTLLFSGIPSKFLDFHESMGIRRIFIKFGNGWYPWEGLQIFVDAAKARGYEVWGWWMCYAVKNEGVIIGTHAKKLGLDGVALDVQGHWKNRAGFTAKGREATAARLINDIKHIYFGKLALCSYWSPQVNPRVPYKVLLDKCDYNFPQVYWIGRFSIKGAMDVLSMCLEQYGRLANFPASKTIPVLAAYGQTYKVGKYTRWWKTTAPQMEAAYYKALQFGCPSVSWWCLDYLLGSSGHEAEGRGKREEAFLEVIKHTNTEQPPPPPPAIVKVHVSGPRDAFEVSQETTQ